MLSSRPVTVLPDTARVSVLLPVLLPTLLKVSLLMPVAIVMAAEARNQQSNTLKVAVIKQPQTVQSAVPEYMRPAQDEGLAGAQLAVQDSNRTGKFLGLSMALETAQADTTEAVIKQAQSWHQAGVGIMLVDLPHASLQALRQSLPSSALLINTGNRSDNLRREQCLPNTLHTITSDSMQTDALAQWMKSRRLTKVLLVKGQHSDDEAYARAVKASLKKFGHTLLAEKTWTFDTDLRRVAGTELQSFTRGHQYDLVWVADRANLFGQLLPFNTHLPRPVIGTHGLTASEWSPVIEAWGAIQLQNRFSHDFQRPMMAKDYAAWIAIRALSEAMTKNRSTEVQALQDSLLTDDFYLAGYKGRKLSFRDWNGQLRQPIPLSHQQALVATAPLDGFLHPSNEMDTLGADRRDSRCQHFQSE